MISYRIDWFDLLAVQGTLKESSPSPQFESINSLVLSLLYGPILSLIHSNSETLLYKLARVPYCVGIGCSVQFSSVAQLCLTLCDPMNRSTPGLPVHHQAMSSSVVPFSSWPQSLPASVFSNESTLHTRWPKYWSFSSALFPPKKSQG